MAEMLLINPRRRKARRASPKRRTAARRKNPVAALARRRRRNPVASLARRVRRRNPIGNLRRASLAGRRRRRNPIGVGGLSKRGIMSMFKDAALGAAGSVAVDAAMGQINGFLPATLQRVPGTVGVGDAVKAALTVILGHAGRKLTKGASVKMAQGALTVQMADIAKQFLPASLTMGGVGFYSPARIVNGTNRVGPIRKGVNQYMQPGVTPMLNQYTQPGRTALLSGSVRGRTAQSREGVTLYR